MTITTDHRFSPRDKKEVLQVQAIECAAKILSRLLDVDIVLQAQRQPGWAGSDAFHAGMYVDNDKLIKINFRNLQGVSLGKIIEVLGHEFRHAVQYKLGMQHDWKGWLGGEVVQTSYIASGYSTKYRAYLNRPQEIDARNYQGLYAQMVFNDEEFSSFIDQIGMVIGEQMMKSDKELTIRGLGYTDYDNIQLFRDREDNIYWAHISQISGAKKWTKSVCKQAWASDWLTTQKWEPIMVPVTIEDLVS